jgi:hypothetical protein
MIVLDFGDCEFTVSLVGNVGLDRHESIRKFFAGVQTNINTSMRGKSTHDDEPWGEPVDIDISGGNAAARDAYVGRCPDCFTEGVRQDMDYCPFCLRRVRWVGSRIADRRYKQQKAAEIDKKAKIRNSRAPSYSEHVFEKMGFDKSVSLDACLVATCLSEQAFKTSGYGKPLSPDELRLVAVKIEKLVYEGDALVRWIRESKDTGAGMVRHFMAYIKGDFKAEKPKPQAVMRRLSDED